MYYRDLGFLIRITTRKMVVPVINEPHERKNVVFYIELKGPVKMKPQINLIQRKCLVICRHLPVV